MGLHEQRAGTRNHHALSDVRRPLVASVCCCTASLLCSAMPFHGFLVHVLQDVPTEPVGACSNGEAESNDQQCDPQHHVNCLYCRDRAAKHQNRARRIDIHPQRLNQIDEGGFLVSHQSIYNLCSALHVHNSHDVCSLPVPTIGTGRYKSSRQAHGRCLN